MRRAGKIALWTVGGLAGVIAAGFGFLQTGAGKGWVASTLTRSLSTSTSSITVGTIDGLVPFDIRVDRITLGDTGGTWLTIDRAALAWSPTALLRGRLRIDALTADSIDVLRQPAPSQASSSSGFALPRLPVAVDLRKLEVARLGLLPGAGRRRQRPGVDQRPRLADRQPRRSYGQAGAHGRATGNRHARCAI